MCTLVLTAVQILFNKIRKIFASAKIHLHFAAGKLSFGEADYHSRVARLSLAATPRLSFRRRRIIIRRRRLYLLPGDIQHKILSLIDAPLAALYGHLTAFGNCDYNVFLARINKFRAEGGVGLLILNACALVGAGGEYVIGVDEVVDGGVSLVLRLTVVRPLEEVGIFDLIAKQRNHSVEALVGHKARALGAVAREDELLAAVADDEPERGYIYNLHLHLSEKYVLGAKILGCDLFEQLGLCPICVGGEDFDLGAAEIIEKGLVAIRIERDHADLGIRMEIAHDLGYLVGKRARNVDHPLGKRVDGRHNDAVDGKARVADDVFKRRADVIDVEMRNYPIKMKHFRSRRLTQGKKTVKAIRAVFSAVMEHIMPVQRKYEAIRLLNFGVTDGVYA